MRILVLQTTRMGDVLQTSPLIQQIRDKHPDAHITVMVRNMGKGIVQRHPAVDDVILYDEDSFFFDLRARDSNRFLRAYRTTDAMIHRLREQRFDLVYNVTHSIASAMLLKLLEIPNVYGAHLSDDWHFVLRGPWTAYFFMSVFSRDYNDLNLCDITRNFASDAPPCRKLIFELHDEEQRFVNTLLAEHQVREKDFVACLQLGASENNKRWSEERFAALAKLLAGRYNAKIFLIGVKDEAVFGDMFAKHAPGVAIPLYGKTTVPQLAALLKRTNILVTNDTGTMHIAAAVGCPIALVSVGHVHYRETGPYGEGHCAIEWRRRTLGRSDYVPGGLEERDQILPEQVFKAIQLALENDVHQPIRQIEETIELNSVDLFMTRFSPDGCLQFYPVIRRPMTERDFMRIAYRAMWIDHLGEGQPRRGEKESINLMIRHYTGPDLKTVRNWTKEFARAFDGLAELSRRGVQTTEKLLDALNKNRNIPKARQLVAELMALDEEGRVYSEIHPPCRPLILLARYERDNLEGSDPVALAQTTLGIYRACFARARLTSRKIELVHDLWKRQNETA
ncbi:MAG TPA: glycosyltransferase family 9 protein [Candidatus Hydrogenedentes bacterium]|nr:glycosyltransferase family 9 protein [Candidatus Hydrogenedentota bacterium]